MVVAFSASCQSKHSTSRHNENVTGVRVKDKSVNDLPSIEYICKNGLSCHKTFIHCLWEWGCCGQIKHCPTIAQQIGAWGGRAK